MQMIKSLNELPNVRAYLQRIKAEARSFKTAVILEKIEKYHKDVSIIRFHKDGEVICDEQYKPTEAEQLLIKSDFSTTEFPEQITLPGPFNYNEDMKKISKENLFEFRDANGQLVMLQERWVGIDWVKGYSNYTYWSDGEWRKLDPEGFLPLWGMENVKENEIVFLHEGCKAARNCQQMIEGKEEHPWKKELSHAAHLGWIGGAASPGRTDFSKLQSLGVKTVYIVSDNDKLGRDVVPIISEKLNLVTYNIQFTDEFPSAFDLGDKFPKHMFEEIEGKTFYNGPDFMSCVHLATWATNKFDMPDGKVNYELREHFKEIWAYVEEADVYVCRILPNLIRNEKILNNMMAPFSHAEEIHPYILKAFTGRTASLCYRPDQKGIVITNANSCSINLHSPTSIKEQEGDPAPFLEYMDYMFPNPAERKEVLKWCATLIGRPDIRMEYAMLLVSEATGIGKTSLGEKILKHLVGIQNTGTPRENDIVDNAFNEWVVNKRLVIINEIYSGHSWKAYHSLKSLITDKDLLVNQKFQRQYHVENWAHIFACSNSMKALKLEEDDRRWFYPEVTEERWKKDQFGKFFTWLQSGGLSIIKFWAKNYGDYVMPGERAPMTQRKKDMIEGSRSDGQVEAAAIAEALIKFEKPAALAMKDIVTSVRDQVQGKVFDSDYELRKTMTDVGAHIVDKRVAISGRTQYVLCNGKLLTEIKKGELTIEELVRQHLVKVAELLENPI